MLSNAGALFHFNLLAVASEDLGGLAEVRELFHFNLLAVAG